MAIAKKKKKFWDVDMPILKKETQLYSFTPQELKGRIIKYDLTRILRGKNAVLMLDVVVDGETLSSSPREMHLLPSFLKKMVRKGTSYVEDSFVAQTQDAQILIKPFLIARRKVSRAVRKALREKARAEIIDYLKKTTAEEVFKDLLKNTLQKPLSLKLKKTYPLSLCEIRVIKVQKYLDRKEPLKKKKEEKVVEEEKEEITKETIPSKKKTTEAKEK